MTFGYPMSYFSGGGGDGGVGFPGEIIVGGDGGKIDGGVGDPLDGGIDGVSPHPQYTGFVGEGGLGEGVDMNPGVDATDGRGFVGEGIVTLGNPNPYLNNPPPTLRSGERILIVLNSPSSPTKSFHRFDGSVLNVVSRNGALLAFVPLFFNQSCTDSFVVFCVNGISLNERSRIDPPRT